MWVWCNLTALVELLDLEWPTPIAVFPLHSGQKPHPDPFPFTDRPLMCCNPKLRRFGNQLQMSLILFIVPTVHCSDSLERQFRLGNWAKAKSPDGRRYFTNCISCSWGVCVLVCLTYDWLPDLGAMRTGATQGQVHLSSLLKSSARRWLPINNN